MARITYITTILQPRNADLSVLLLANPFIKKIPNIKVIGQFGTFPKRSITISHSSTVL